MSSGIEDKNAKPYNTDSRKSAESCGCDEGAQHVYRRAGWKARDGSFRQSYCTECHGDFKKLSGKKRTAKLGEIKLKTGCIDCGYKEHACALDFYHIGPKLFSIGTDLSVPWKKVLLEIAKCIVVCANCHRVRHHASR
jgi:hypothetical protein